MVNSARSFLMIYPQRIYLLMEACSGSSLALSGSPVRNHEGHHVSSFETRPAGRSIIIRAHSVVKHRRRDEAAEFALDQLGQFQRRTVFQPWPDDLHAKRQTL